MRSRIAFRMTSCGNDVIKMRNNQMLLKKVKLVLTAQNVLYVILLQEWPVLKYEEA